MKNIIKSNLYKYSKNIWSYIFLGFIILEFVATIYRAINLDKGASMTGINTLIMSLSGLNILIIFLIFVAINISADYNTNALRNIIGRGVTREKYLIGNIITIIGLYIVVWLIVSTVVTVINTITVGFGRIENPFNLFLALVMCIIFAIATITMVSVLTMIFKNGIIAVVIVGFIYVMNGLLKFSELVFFKSKFNLDYISIFHYILSEMHNINNTKTLLFGIYAGIGYIIVFMIIGKLVLKRQEIK